MTAPDHEPTEEPTQAVSPGNDTEQQKDDPGQGNPAMVDPIAAAGAEFPGT